MDLSGYTTESVQALKNVLLEVKAVMEDPEADQKEVDAAEKALRASRDGLVAVEDAKKQIAVRKWLRQEMRHHQSDGHLQVFWQCLRLWQRSL